MTKNKIVARSAMNVYLTSLGLKESKAELEYLKKVKKPEISQKINQNKKY